MSSRREAAPHTRVAAAADRGRRGRFGRIGRRRALGGTGGAAAPCDRPPGLRVSQRRQAARAVRLIVLDGALASAPCRGQGGARSRHRSRQPPPAGTADRRAGRRAARPGAARQRSRCRDAGPGNDPARTAAGAATPGHGPGGGAPACGGRTARSSLSLPASSRSATAPDGGAGALAHSGERPPALPPACPCRSDRDARAAWFPGPFPADRPAARRQHRLAGFPAARSPSRLPTSTTVSASQISRSATGISSRFCGACGPPVSITTRLRAMLSRWQGRRAAIWAACVRRPRRRRQGTRSAGHGG